MNEVIQHIEQGEVIFYQPDETIRLEVRLVDDTVWLTQAQMAELFQKDQSVIARHIGNVFREGELQETSNMQILHNTLSKYKPTKIYNLNVISFHPSKLHLANTMFTACKCRVYALQTLCLQRANAVFCSIRRLAWRCRMEGWKDNL